MNSGLRLAFFVSFLALLAFPFCLRAQGPHPASVNKTFPFSFFRFHDFYVEAQDLQWGLGEEDFQISVPDEGKMNQISFPGGKLRRERIRLDQDRIGTSYATAVTRDGLYLFEGSGVSYFTKDGKKQHWHQSLDEQFSGRRLDGPAYSMADGSAVVFLQHLGRGDIDEVELTRFHPEKGKREVLLTLRGVMDGGYGYLSRFTLPDGFIAVRSFNRLSEYQIGRAHV